MSARSDLITHLVRKEIEVASDLEDCKKRLSFSASTIHALTIELAEIRDLLAELRATVSEADV